MGRAQWRPGRLTTYSTSGKVQMAMNAAEKNEARKLANQQLQDRFKEIFQRRHDCIHTATDRGSPLNLWTRVGPY